jgi:hypothetical protein
METRNQSSIQKGGDEGAKMMTTKKNDLFDDESEVKPGCSFYSRAKMHW